MRYIEEPSYSINTIIPNKNFIKKKSINCVGVINLIRINNLLIPGSYNPNFKYPGRTYIWFKYLEKQNKLEKIIINDLYNIR